MGGGDKHELTRESLKTMNTMGQPLGNFLAKLLGEAKLTFVLHLLEKRINPILSLEKEVWLSKESRIDSVP